MGIVINRSWLSAALKQRCHFRLDRRIHAPLCLTPLWREYIFLVQSRHYLFVIGCIQGAPMSWLSCKRIHSRTSTKRRRQCELSLMVLQLNSKALSMQVTNDTLFPRTVTKPRWIDPNWSLVCTTPSQTSTFSISAIFYGILSTLLFLVKRLSCHFALSWLHAPVDLCFD